METQIRVLTDWDYEVRIIWGKLGDKLEILIEVKPEHRWDSDTLKAANPL